MWCSRWSGRCSRAYLEGHDALPDAPLVSGVPVSTRAEGDTAQDNQITSMFVSLATDEADPVERLLAVHAVDQSAKGMTKALSARQIQSIGEVASPLLLGNAIRAVVPRRADVALSAADQHARVERARPADRSLHVRRQGDGDLPELGDPRGHGDQHHRVQLPRPARLRHPRRSRARARRLGASPRASTAALAELLAASDLGAPTPVDDPFRVSVAAPADVDHVDALVVA